MYFVYRDGVYLDASGQSFRDFMQGRLPVYPGHLPTMDDWEAHLTTVFPEVRLKRFLEMRGADNGPWRSICSLPALWVRGSACAAMLGHGHRPTDAARAARRWACCTTSRRCKRLWT